MYHVLAFLPFLFHFRTASLVFTLFFYLHSLYFLVLVLASLVFYPFHVFLLPLTFRFLTLDLIFYLINLGFCSFIWTGFVSYVWVPFCLNVMLSSFFVIIWLDDLVTLLLGMHRWCLSVLSYKICAGTFVNRCPVICHRLCQNWKTKGD